LKPILLCTLLLIFAATLPRAAADEWISEQYHCALTIPTQESWTGAVRQTLPEGEVIFHAVSMVSSHGMMITHVPDMPVGDLGNSALVKRITELLELQGWSVEPPTPLVWKNRQFLQFVGQRRDVVSGKLIGIIRATVRERNLYVIAAYGKGEADRAVESDFMRVMETFRFNEKTAVIPDKAEVPPSLYHAATIGVGVSVAVLIAAFAAVMFRSRHGTEDHWA
jgi:hypothetical protein